MINRRQRPWGLTGSHYAPYGLRDAVARVATLSPREVDVFSRHGEGHMRLAAQWRVESPAQFHELVTGWGLAALVPGPRGRHIRSD